MHLFWWGANDSITWINHISNWNSWFCLVIVTTRAAYAFGQFVLHLSNSLNNIKILNEWALIEIRSIIIIFNNYTRAMMISIISIESFISIYYLLSMNSIFILLYLFTWYRWRHFLIHTYVFAALNCIKLLLFKYFHLRLRRWSWRLLYWLFYYTWRFSMFLYVILVYKFIRLCLILAWCFL